MDTRGPSTRRGARRAPRPRPRLRLDVTATLLGALALLIAWVFLVLAAIDFGTAARGGRSEAWAYLGIASLGAITCLFAALMLGARTLRQVGILNDPTNAHETDRTHKPDHRH